MNYEKNFEKGKIKVYCPNCKTTYLEYFENITPNYRCKVCHHELPIFIRPAPNGLSISLDIKDINGNETLSVEDAIVLMEANGGYIDGDRREIIIPVVK